MLTRKNPDDALAGAKEGGLEKTLGVWDLIILGVGAIIGSGIFAVVPRRPNDCSVSGVIISPSCRMYSSLTGPVKYKSVLEVFSLKPPPFILKLPRVNLMSVPVSE